MNRELIEDRIQERERTEIEKWEINWGFDLGALGAKERSFKRAGRIFFGV